MELREGDRRKGRKVRPGEAHSEFRFSRPGCLVLALAVVLAACASDDGAAPPATSSAAPPTSPGGGTSPSPGGPAPTSPDGPGGPAPTDAPAPTRPADDPFAAARGRVGGFARVLLRPAPAERLVIEVLVEDGAEPAGGTLDHLAGVLAEVAAKPVTVADPVALPPAGDGSRDAAALRALADRFAEAEQGEDGRAVVRLLFVRGGLAGDDRALGVAMRGDLAAVFPERIEDAASLLVGPAEIEEAVATHELGHLLGLVDLALATGRADPAHPGHSPNRGSVMFHAIESSEITVVLDGPPPTRFDEADRADLAALRAGR